MCASEAAGIDLCRRHTSNQYVALERSCKQPVLSILNTTKKLSRSCGGRGGKGQEIWFQHVHCSISFRFLGEKMSKGHTRTHTYTHIHKYAHVRTPSHNHIPVISRLHSFPLSHSRTQSMWGASVKIVTAAASAGTCEWLWGAGVKNLAAAATSTTAEDIKSQDRKGKNCRGEVFLVCSARPYESCTNT